MLNIEDIRKGIKEPKIIDDIRKNIINSFKDLEFIEDVHKYYITKNNKRQELLSVSAITHKFAPYVDWELIKENKVKKINLQRSSLNQPLITKEDLEREWLEVNITSTNMGTGVHLFGEMYMYFIMGMIDKVEENDIIKAQYEKGYLIPHSGKEKAICKYWEDIYNTKDLYPIIPETRVYIGINDKYKLNTPYAGTFDILIGYLKSDGDVELCIHDFKTNKDLFNSYNRKYNNTLLEPFDDMINESLSFYTLQLSCYQLALMQLGYKICDRRIIWLKDDGTYEKIKVPDVTDKLIKYL